MYNIIFQSACVAANKRPPVFAQVLVIMIVMIFSAQSATAADRRDAVIVYSGFGYLDGSVQPVLQKLLYEETASDWIEAGNALLRTGEEAIGQNFTPRAIRRWSPYGVVRNGDDLTAALRKKQRQDDITQSDRDAMFDTFDTVLGVILVGGLEVSAVQEVTSQLKGPPAFTHWFLTSVTALLVDLKTQRVVLSSTAMGAERIFGSYNMTLADKDMIALSSAAYGRASADASESLAKLMKRHGLSRLDGGRSGASHIVTDALVKDSKENINALFQRIPFTSRPLSKCEKTPSCPPGADDCEKLSAVLAHGMTAALSSAGRVTIPPFGWSRWRGGAATNTTIRLSLPELRNAPKALDDLIFDQNPATADVKVVPVFWSAEPIIAFDKDGLSEARTWQVELNYKTVRTRPDDCAVKIVESEILPASGPAMAEVAAMTGPPGRRENDASLDRLLIMMSLHKAFSDVLPTMIEGD